MARGTPALLKIHGIDHPIKSELAQFGNGGVWVTDRSLALELTKLAKEEGLPVFLKNAPAIFFPYSRVEWMMVPAEKIPAEA